MSVNDSPGTLRVGILVGSLRREAFTRKVAASLTEMLAPSLSMRPIELSALDMFNQDFDAMGQTPASWTRFRQEVAAVDGVVFVTPEYNRSLPALLKNALDIGSWPFGHNRWAGKPGAIVGVSPGRFGAIAAAQALRQPASFLGIDLMPQPEAYLSVSEGDFDARGVLVGESSRKALEQFARAFVQWMARARRG